LTSVITERETSGAKKVAPLIRWTAAFTRPGWTSLFGSRKKTFRVMGIHDSERYFFACSCFLSQRTFELNGMNATNMPRQDALNRFSSTWRSPASIGFQEVALE
jgi:hypothetical protein